MWSYNYIGGNESLNETGEIKKITDKFYLLYIQMVAKPPVWGLIANYFLYKNHDDYTKQDRISMDTLMTLKTVVEKKFNHKICIAITADMLNEMFTSYGRFFRKDKTSEDIIVVNQISLFEELAFDHNFSFEVQDKETRINYKRAIYDFVHDPRYHDISSKGKAPIHLV